MTDTIELQGPYTVPHDGAPDIGLLGYASPLHDGESGIPATTRVNAPPPRDFHSDGSDLLYAERDRDTSGRESTVDKSTLPFATASSVNRFAPNPRSFVIDEPRWTQRLSPVSTWIRNMLGFAPKRFTGNHGSMADQMRTYQPNGMVPQRSSRSTYRADAPNSGLSTVDIPLHSEPVSGTIRQLNVPRGNSGAYRL